MSERRKGKIGKSVLVNGIVICIAVAAISLSLIPGLAAQGNGAIVNVTVNAPEYVKGTFNADIDVDSITGFNSGQFDLTFDSGVVNVTVVADGMLDSEMIPVDRWEFVDSDTIRVILDVPGVTGVNGSGNLATICFVVVGMGGDKSVLDLSDGMLVNTEAETVPATWIDDEVIVGPVNVEVNAPEFVDAGGTFTATIDVVDDIANFNMALFDLTFDSSVVKVTNVTDGSMDGTAIPITTWDFVDSNTIRVMCELSGVTGVTGSGNIATICFEVLGIGGDRSALEISNGILANNEADEIPATWVGDEVIVGPVSVEVNAPESVDAGGTFTATIDVVDDIANFNMALFDLTFDSSVVNVTDVTDGSLGGTAIPITTWDFIDSNTIKVMSELSGVSGVTGTGNIATISFEVVGNAGDKCVLEISDGMLANNEANEIPVVWVADEVTLK